MNFLRINLAARFSYRFQSNRVLCFFFKEYKEIRLLKREKNMCNRICKIFWFFYFVYLFYSLVLLFQLDVVILIRYTCASAM